MSFTAESHEFLSIQSKKNTQSYPITPPHPTPGTSASAINSSPSLDTPLSLSYTDSPLALFANIASSSRTTVTHGLTNDLMVPISSHNETMTDRKKRRGRPRTVSTNTSPSKRKKGSNNDEGRVPSQIAGVNQGSSNLKLELLDEGLQDTLPEVSPTRAKRSGAALPKKTRRPKKNDYDHDLATGVSISGNRYFSKASAKNNVEASAFD
jgi:hypothetical protein